MKEIEDLSIADVEAMRQRKKRNPTIDKTHPELLDEWDYEKNKILDPSDVTPGLDINVYWKCKHGHTWKARIPNRVNNGSGCPYCAGKAVWPGFNDLATTHPDVAKTWHPTLNGNITPKDVTYGKCRDTYWWQCDHGHHYPARIADRVKGKGCPYCARKLAWPGETDFPTTHPHLMKDWDWEKNVGIDPTQILYGNRTIKPYWKCDKGHSWPICVADRAAGHGCPYCSNKKILIGFNDLATTHPHLLDEWDYEKNTIKPTEVIAGNKKIDIWWKCKCGNSWPADAYTRSTGCGCPECARKQKTSYPEQKVFYHIKQYFPDAINSYYPSWLNGKEIDIYIPSLKVGIEYDGHVWHKDNKKDLAKSKLCRPHLTNLIRLRETGCPTIRDKSIHINVEPDSEPALTKAIAKVLKTNGVTNPIVNPSDFTKKDFQELRSSYINL